MLGRYRGWETPYEATNSLVNWMNVEELNLPANFPNRVGIDQRFRKYLVKKYSRKE
ncbi:MAG: hypothetical protein ANABAC_2848 [Anaerolineae bacterium]|nr:MAG: hypothetical protein ANABAC_2848 [Anaerolineae bacterium]